MRLVRVAVYATDTIAVPRTPRTQSRPRLPLRRALVVGPSMAPRLRHGDQVLVWMRPPRRLRAGMVVVLELPSAPLSVKRVTRVHPDGAVWVQGDNPFGSTDSRQLGAVEAACVRGRVLGRLWPKPVLIRPHTTPIGPEGD